jgi:hypothetical protein
MVARSCEGYYGVSNVRCVKRVKVSARTSKRGGRLNKCVNVLC